MDHLEVVARSKKAKDKVLAESHIPEELRDQAINMIELLKTYYDFMNLASHSYTLDSQVYTAEVRNGRAIFVAPEDYYFYDDEMAVDGSALSDPRGAAIDTTDKSILISASNGMPLALQTVYGQQYGTRFTVYELEEYNHKIVTLTTSMRVYTGENPSYVITKMKQLPDMDALTKEFMDKMHDEYAANIPKSFAIDKHIFYKNLIHFYKERGSQESIEVFFKVMYNDNVDIAYPRDKMLIPSSGKWNSELGVWHDRGGFLSDVMKLQDSYFYQKFSYVIKTGSNMSKWGNAFNNLIHPAGFKFFGEVAFYLEVLSKRYADGSRVKWYIGDEDTAEPTWHSSVYTGGGDQPTTVMPQHQPGMIGLEDYNLILTMFAVFFGPHVYSVLQPGVGNDIGVDSVVVERSGRAYKNVPTVRFSAPQIPIKDGGITATGTAVLDGEGYLIAINITNPGTGYYYPPVIVLTDQARNKVIQQQYELLFNDLFAVRREKTDKDNDYVLNKQIWYDTMKLITSAPMSDFEHYTIDELHERQIQPTYMLGTEIYIQPELLDNSTEPANDAERLARILITEQKLNQYHL
jgi:hypothetical protein